MTRDMLMALGLGVVACGWAWLAAMLGNYLRRRM